VRLRLGDLTFDADARQLRRGADEIHLSPKAFELLKLLIESRPRAISKKELHERLWPETFVSEANLATLAAEVREALDDDPRQPRFIRTAHRFGYAFSGSAVEEAAVNPTGDSTTFCWLIRDGRRLPLQAGENVLGRDADDGIQIESPTVSRRHARIVVAGAGATIEDLASKNGTRLRGEAVSSAVTLTDGDEIRVGSVVLRFRIASGSKTATWSDTEL
jgi:DNA-binding winged helix-turn-helix (wHTH) protein